MHLKIIHHSLVVFVYLAINQSLILGPHPPVQPAKPGAVLIRQIRAYVSVLLLFAMI